MQKQFMSLCHGNLYATTLHVINSAIVKLSKLSYAHKVYRGIRDKGLPDAFWKANESGVKGGIETAFMSTTLDRNVAMQYAGDGKIGVIFEIQQGMIDRGADLMWISQYPHEREITFTPLTGLEVQSTRVEGRVLVVETKLSVNLSSLTIEQVLGKRKTVVQDMTEGLLLELQGELQYEMDSGNVPFRKTLPQQGKQLFQEAIQNEMLCNVAEWFNDDEHFNAAVNDALRLKKGVKSDLGKLDPDVTPLQLRGWDLTMAARGTMLIGFLKLRGDEDGPKAELIDLRDTAISEPLAKRVAQAVAAANRPLALDVRSNAGMGVAGVAALEGLLRSGCLTTLCGATRQGASLALDKKEMWTEADQRKLVLGDVEAALLLAEIRGGGAARVTLGADSFGNTHVHAAVERGDEALLAALADTVDAAELSRANLNGATALHKAARGGQLAAVELLLRRGVPVDCVDYWGESPLLKASKGGYATLVQQLLRMGAQPSAQNHRGMSALMFAVEGAHAEVVRALLGAVEGGELKAMLSLKSQYDDTALLIAAAQGHAEVARLLLHAGADTTATKERKTAAGWAGGKGGNARSAVLGLLQGESPEC